MCELLLSLGQLYYRRHQIVRGSVCADFMWSHGVQGLALNDLLIKAGPPLNGLIM